MKIKNRVKDVRKKMGITATQLSTQAKIGRNVLWRVERDADGMSYDTSLGTCFAIANALGKSVSDIFYLGD